MKQGFIIGFLFIIHFSLQAQRKVDPFEKFYFGGGMGLSLGTNRTNISASPLMGYKITERFSAGVGITYQYDSYKNVNLNLNHYGASVFTRFIITQQFFATTEYEYMTIEFPSPDLKTTSRMGFDSFFVGGGFAQPLSKNASFVIIGLYNVMYDPAKVSPYNSPYIVRAGFAVGF